MTKMQRLTIWVVGFIILLLLIRSLSDVLLPFVVGMIVAYFLDPIADKLEAKGCSRVLATVIITVGFFFLIVAFMIMLLPLLQTQFFAIAERIPDFLALAKNLMQRSIITLETVIPSDTLQKASGLAENYFGTLMGWLKTIASQVWSGGAALFSILSLIIITPIVSFYMLLEWDSIVSKMDALLPRQQATIIRSQLKLMDQAISAFVRGQASVCLVLATFYATALSLIGLETGLLIGMCAGLLSFIPYVGAVIGMVIGLGIAILQFDSFSPILVVGIIFIFGQLTESYILTPRLVGDKVGLHDLWIIFALMTGGSLFGFVGVLLAVPTAAILGVIIRFLIGEYLLSPLYNESNVINDKRDNS